MQRHLLPLSFTGSCAHRYDADPLQPSLAEREDERGLVSVKHDLISATTCCGQDEVMVVVNGCAFCGASLLARRWRVNGSIVVASHPLLHFIA